MSACALACLFIIYLSELRKLNYFRELSEFFSMNSCIRIN